MAKKSSGEFNPDEYLASQPNSEFNPDEYLANADTEKKNSIPT